MNKENTNTSMENVVNNIRNSKVSELNMLFNNKLTENGDDSFKSTGNRLVDILFKSEYYSNHLSNVRIGNSNVERLFSMFIRDPRNGMKYRDLGRTLMIQSGVTGRQAATAGRFDDLWKTTIDGKTNSEWVSYIIKECQNGNELAKKWMPHYVGKNNGKVSKTTIAASLMRKAYNAMNPTAQLNKQQYNKFVKVSTVESKLSQHNNDAIDFSKLPSLALLKYWARFNGTSVKHQNDDMKERFQAYLDSVKKGEAKMNMSIASVYDIYRHVNDIDADLVFSQIEKISGSWLPILDSSASMFDQNDSIGKACAVAHYLAKCSTYSPNQVISFGHNPKLIDITVDADNSISHSPYDESDLHGMPTYNASSEYAKEINRMYVGFDGNDTNFGAVMDMLSQLKSEFPEYLIVLSDMEFNHSSKMSKDALMSSWRDKGINTKLIWWNFNSRHETVPETDEYGNLFMSGYSPMLLKFLEAGFDGIEFLANLMVEYGKTLPKDIMDELA